MTPCQQIVTLLYFFQFLANLQPSRSRIPDTWSIKLTFSLTVTFYLQHSSYTIALNKVAIFAKKMLIFYTKNADISKIKWFLVLKSLFHKTTHVCVLSYQISRFQHSSNDFQIAGGSNSTQSKLLKNPPLLGLKLHWG